MCGISGILHPNGSDTLELFIRAMNDAIRHRGPDDEGYLLADSTYLQVASGNDTSPEIHRSSLPWSISKDSISRPVLALGHRRLSILDLNATGHQPLCDADRKYWIVYNGELYNYQSIRKALEGKGHQFLGQSDTEVVLHAWMEWGPSCLLQFEGMWAFAIYDHAAQKLYAARDRFGVKPLYYLHDAHRFAFCSEIKGLLVLPEVTRRIHARAAYQYLVLGLSEAMEESIFDGIKELMPAHWLELDISSLQCTTHRYYTLPLAESQAITKYSPEELFGLIEKAVAQRAHADVPVGACLSGGLDSSSLISVLLQQSAQSRPLFTASFPDSPKDETHWASILGKHQGVEWHINYPKAHELAENFEGLIFTQDIPFYSMSVFTHWHLMHSVKQKSIKVVFDGQGGDELFAGYPLHQLLLGRDRCINGNIITAFRENSLGLSPWKNIAGLSSFMLKNRLFQLSPVLFYKYYQRSIPENTCIRPSLWNNHADDFIQHYQRYQLPLNSFLHYQFTQGELKHLLRVGDRNSMHHGIETRTPFSDAHSLIEYVFGIPGNIKIQQHQSKYLLRECMKQVVPEALRLRKDKVGFATTEEKWIHAMHEYFSDLVEDSRDEWIDIPVLKKNLSSFIQHGQDLKINRLWRILNYLSWKKVMKIS
ncbi:MAG: asparagine synthase (glutamine-hydrolyzing) [Cytophagaceae bacterium]|jgi:asparagine synthase (glutamine-hydrolysing)|nr:asparagine synthase (glutamine-hydrolyzing) [Cytophagaceae bacterium]